MQGIAYLLFRLVFLVLQCPSFSYDPTILPVTLYFVDWSVGAVILIDLRNIAGVFFILFPPRTCCLADLTIIHLNHFTWIISTFLYLYS